MAETRRRVPDQPGSPSVRKKHAGAQCWRTPARKNTLLTVRLPGGSSETILVTNEKVKPKVSTKQQKRKRISAGYVYNFGFQCRGVQFHKGTTMRSWTADLDTRFDREGIVQDWVLQAISEVTEAETKKKNEGGRDASAINESAARQRLARPPRVLQQPDPMDTTGEEEEEEAAQHSVRHSRAATRAATPPFAASTYGISYTDKGEFDHRHDRGVGGRYGGKRKAGKYGSEHARRAEHEQRQRERAEPAFAEPCALRNISLINHSAAAGPARRAIAACFLKRSRWKRSSKSHGVSRHRGSPVSRSRQPIPRNGAGSGSRQLTPSSSGKSAAQHRRPAPPSRPVPVDLPSPVKSRCAVEANIQKRCPPIKCNVYSGHQVQHERLACRAAGSAP